MLSKSFRHSLPKRCCPKQKVMFHVRKTGVLRTIAMATSAWFVDLARTIWATLLKTAFNGKVVVLTEYCLVSHSGCALRVRTPSTHPEYALRVRTPSTQPEYAPQVRTPSTHFEYAPRVRTPSTHPAYALRVLDQLMN